MTFTTCWCYTTNKYGASTTNNKDAIKLAFLNGKEEDAIYPLTTKETVRSQKKDPDQKSKTRKEGYSITL